MQLHPQMKAILDQAAAAGGKPFHSMTPVEARQGIAALLEPFNSAPEKVAKSEKRNIPGPGGQIPVQIYTPKAARRFRCWFTFTAADGQSAIPRRGIRFAAHCATLQDA